MRRKIFNLFNDMPYEMKVLFSNLSKYVPRKYIFGKKYEKYLNFIRKTDKYNQKKINEIEEIELSKILLHAYKKSKLYSEIINSIGADEKEIINYPKDILNKLPFTDKKFIQNHYNELITKDLSKYKCDYTSTGGTSGEPFYFHINSDRSIKEWAFFVDLWGRVGFTLNSKRASFRGSTISSKKGWEDDWITRERKFSSFELTDNYLNKIWKDLTNFNPEYIYAYPSTALSICQFLRRNNKKLPETLKAILIGSENIYDGQDAFIEEITKLRPFKWYGHSEKLVLAGECEKSSFYHAYPQYGYTEFINSNNETAKPEEFAEIVGTGFINTVLPFIRYKTGDFCTFVGDKCTKCGRNYKIFKDVRGRWTQEVLFGKDGNAICMSAINVHSKNFKNVFRYQFLQNKPGEALLKIMPKDNFNEGEKNKIIQEFNNKFNKNVIVKALIVDDIPLTKRGKYKFIDQRIQTKTRI